MRSRYKVFAEEYPYFITSTIVGWIPIFTQKIYNDILIDAFRFCQQQKKLKIYAFVIMENHFHLIVEGKNVSKIMQGLKGYTAQKIITTLKEQKEKWLLDQLAFFRQKNKTKSTYQVWQEGFHPQMITSEAMLQQKIDYIHFNPVKRGLIRDPEHWVYSSASFFTGGESILSIDQME